MSQRFFLLLFIVGGLGAVFARDPDYPSHTITTTGRQSLARTGAVLATGIRPGLWEGTIELRQKGTAFFSLSSGGAAGSHAPSSPLSLRILAPGSGALLTMTEQSMFGLPLSDIFWRENSLSFTLETGSDVSSLRFNGFLAKTPPGTAPKIVGICRGEDLEGSFSLVFVPDSLLPGETRLSFDIGMGSIPGTLLVPDNATGPIPLVVVIAASGTTDRDGNNFNVPGRNDAYKMIALALARQGIACFRYDKRGSGEAYKLVYDESFLRFYQYVNDASEVISRFKGDERFSRIVILGHAEGALVGAAALNKLESPGTFVESMIMLCASDKSPFMGVEESLVGTPPELADEALEIMKALRSGMEYPSPSPYFADFFRPSFQAYLSSWFQYDPAVEIPKIMVTVSFVHGGRDLQVSYDELDRLESLMPGASVFLIPGMNHALKEVPDDRDSNFDSFTDPSYPLGHGLVDLVTAVAKAMPVPAGIPRYQRGQTR